MRKNKKDPATARPDITHQVRHCVCFVSSSFLGGATVHTVNTVSVVELNCIAGWITFTKGIHSQVLIDSLDTINAYSRYPRYLGAVDTLGAVDIGMLTECHPCAN